MAIPLADNSSSSGVTAGVVRRTKPFGEGGMETAATVELAAEMTTGVQLSRVPAENAVPPK